MDSPHLQGMGSAVLRHDVGADDHDPAEVGGVHFLAIGLFTLPTG